MAKAGARARVVYIGTVGAVDARQYCFGGWLNSVLVMLVGGQSNDFKVNWLGGI